MEGGPVGAIEQVQVVRGVPEVADAGVSRGTARNHSVDARRQHAGPRLLPVLHSQVSKKGVEMRENLSLGRRELEIHFPLQMCLPALICRGKTLKRGPQNSSFRSKTN